MKFKMGLPPAGAYDAANAKRLIGNYGRLHAVATLVGLAVVLPCFYLLWTLLFPDIRAWAIFDEPPGIFIGSLLSVVVIHELVHLLALPKCGFNPLTFVGFDPKTHLPYVAYLGGLTKSKALAVALMPALVLSVLPLGAVRLLSPEWANIVAACAILNAAVSSGDLCIAWLLLRRVPRGGMLHGEFYSVAGQETDGCAA